MLNLYPRSIGHWFECLGIIGFLHVQLKRNQHLDRCQIEFGANLFGNGDEYVNREIDHYGARWGPTA